MKDVERDRHERGLGCFQGLTAAECRERHAEAFAAFERYEAEPAIPGGESRGSGGRRLFADDREVVEADLRLAAVDLVFYHLRQHFFRILFADRTLQVPVLHQFDLRMMAYAERGVQILIHFSRESADQRRSDFVHTRLHTPTSRSA